MARKTATPRKSLSSRAVKPVAGAHPRLGGPTLADRLAALQDRHGMKYGIHTTDKDDGTEDVRVYLEKTDDDGKVLIGGDRVTGYGSTREEAVVDLEAKLGEVLK